MSENTFCTKCGQDIQKCHCLTWKDEEIARLEAQVLARDSYIKSLEQYRTMDGERIKSLEAKAEQAEKDSKDFQFAYESEKEFCMKVMAERDKLQDQNARLQMMSDNACSELEEQHKVNARLKDAGEMLWVVLANVSGGDWTKQNKEWQEAASKWRDNYFQQLSNQGDGK